MLGSGNLPSDFRASTFWEMTTCDHQAVTGIAVSLVNPETVGRSPHFFQARSSCTCVSRG